VFFLSAAADFLYHYRTLCTSNEKGFSALWGKFAADILMQDWDTALEDMTRLREIIDSKVWLAAHGTEKHPSCCSTMVLGRKTDVLVIGVVYRRSSHR
jgi:hypothetical protein